MVVVAAGFGHRFAGDKVLAEVDGRPLLALTVSRVRHLVDEVVLVCRPEQRPALEHLGVTLADGGATRTGSEAAGLRALSAVHDLIGIHDGARPNVFPALVERLFGAAGTHGGAVPVLAPRAPIIDLTTGGVVDDALAVQTPQVFRGPDLVAAYRGRGDLEGHDTVDVVQRRTALRIVAVAGDPRNVKVTYPGDLGLVVP